MNRRQVLKTLACLLPLPFVARMFGEKEVPRFEKVKNPPRYAMYKIPEWKGGNDSPFFTDPEGVERWKLNLGRIDYEKE